MILWPVIFAVFTIRSTIGLVSMFAATPRTWLFFIFFISPVNLDKNPLVPSIPLTAVMSFASIIKFGNLSLKVNILPAIELGSPTLLKPIPRPYLNSFCMIPPVLVTPIRLKLPPFFRSARAEKYSVCTVSRLVVSFSRFQLPLPKYFSFK